MTQMWKNKALTTTVNSRIRSEIDDDLEQSIEDDYLDFDTPQQVSSLSI